MDDLFQGASGGLSLDSGVKKGIQGGGKLLILLGCAFFGTLEPASRSPVFSGLMADEQQRVDIIRGVLPAVLMEDPG